MSKVYRYSEDEAEKSKDMMALLIEGIRAASYGRSKPTSLGFSSLESRRFNRETGWDVIMEPGIACTHKYPKVWKHQDIYPVIDDDIEILFKDQATDDLRNRLKSGELSEPASEQLFSTIVIPYLDPNDPDPLGTAGFMQEVVLPDLKAMYAPDLDWYKTLQKRVIEAMGVPADLLQENPLCRLRGREVITSGGKGGRSGRGMGRYYNESIVDCKAPPYYSFEET